PAMATRQQPRDAVERATRGILSVLGLRRTRVQCHPYPQWTGRAPARRVQRPLRRERRAECVERGGKRYAEGIANDLKDVAVMLRGGCVEQRMVLGERGLHGIWPPFPQVGAAFDVGEKKRDRS